jgi:1,2-diacylglycerol 3-alpha-glucosyltransferase
MKIAYLTQSFPPMISGASLVVQHLAQGMAARRHDVLVIAASDTGKPYFTQEPGLKIVRLQSLPNPSRANQHFISWAYSDILYELKPFAPEVIHLHDTLTVGLAGIIVGKKLGVPIAVTTHTLPWFVSNYLPDLPGLRVGAENILWKYCRWLHHQTQHFISPTPTTAKTIEVYAGFRPAVISNGMDLDRFHFHPVDTAQRNHLCQRFALNPVHPIILHVGRLDTDKQVNLVIQAAAKTMHNSDAQLLIVGDGQQREKLIQLAEWYGIRERSHFSGFVQPANELPDLYRIASVFVTGSTNETQGLVLLEAMASGLPVVAFRATCFPEIIHDGVNGYLVPPKDADAMAQRLADILQHLALARQMGAEGRKLAEQHSRSRSLDRHEALYQILCDQQVPENKVEVSLFPNGRGLRNSISKNSRSY